MKRNGQGIKTKDAVNLLFRIPNDEAGMQFLSDCKRFMNKESYRLRLRGHGPENRPANYGHIRMEDKPTWFAVYLIAKNIAGKGDHRTIGKLVTVNEAKWEKRNHWLINRYAEIIQSDESKEKRITMMQEALNKQWDI